ncbi:MAG: serine/threonine protein kinase [Leptolyngbyaceae cyanobacterium]
MDDFLTPKLDNKDEVIEHLTYRGYSLVEQLGTSQKMGTYIVQDNREPEGYYCLVRVLPLNESEQTPVLEVFHPTPIVPDSAQLLGGFQIDGCSYLMRQYIHGQPLTWEIPTQQGWTDTQVVNLLKPVLHTLAKCHQHRVVHGNLHPNNLIRQPNGQLVLTDFSGNQGYYHQTLRRQKSGLKSNVLGLLERQAYAAPEQWQGNHQPSSDIYALGLLGIQFLLGRQIWTSEIQLSHLLERLPYQPLVTVLRRMVNVVPELRYSNAQEILSALENIDKSDKSKVDQPAKVPALASVVKQSVDGASAQALSVPHLQPVSRQPFSDLGEPGYGLGGLKSLSSEFVTPTLVSPMFVGVNTLRFGSVPLVEIPPIFASEPVLSDGEQASEDDSESYLLTSVRSQAASSTSRFRWTPAVLALTASVGGFAAYCSWAYRHQKTPTLPKISSSQSLPAAGTVSSTPLPLPETPSIIDSIPAFSQSGARY